MRTHTPALPLLLVAGLLLLSAAGSPASAAEKVTRALPSYRMSGNRSARSLQGLLGFLHGFRLGHGLATGLQAQSKLYDLSYHPVPSWYAPIIIAPAAPAPPAPASQQQIVNLQSTDDLRENYQEMNGNNVQVIKNFAALVNLPSKDSLNHVSSTNNDANEQINLEDVDSNGLTLTNKPRREAPVINKSLANKTTDTLSDDSCDDDKNNCTENNYMNESTIGLDSNESTTLAPEQITVTGEIIDPEIISNASSILKPINTYPNRTHPYPKRNYFGNNVDQISITTDVAPTLPEIRSSVIDKTYPHTLTLPLVDTNWKDFAKVKLDDSGFKPIIRNFYDYRGYSDQFYLP